MDRYFWGSSGATAEAPEITNVLLKSGLYRTLLRHKRLYFNSSVEFEDHIPSRVTQCNSSNMESFLKSRI